MATVTLNVTVNGGAPPFSIQVSLFEHGNDILDITSTHSFTHVFNNLEKGKNYDITIGGFNSAGGNTVCSMTTDDITLTPASDQTPATRTGVSYRVDFNFDVNN